MRFLIVKTSALGDIVQTYPVLQYLKQRFPDAEIDWIVEKQNAELVSSHPYISRTLYAQTKEWRKLKKLNEFLEFRKQLQAFEYDAVFDLQGNFKSGLLTFLAKSKHKIGFAWKDAPEWPNIFFTNKRYSLPPGANIRQDYLFLTKSFFDDKESFEILGVPLKTTEEQRTQIEKTLNNPLLQGRKRVMVCPGSAWPNKQMREEAIATMLQSLHQRSRCAFLFVWGTQEERDVCLRLQQQFPRQGILLERMHLPALQHCMGHMDLVVAMDSLPLHLAGSAGVATFSVFGASSAKKYNPLGTQHVAVQGACPYGRTFDKRCPILRTCPTGACIRSLTGNEKDLIISLE